MRLVSLALRDTNWTRFWVPREATLHLDLNGYLADPEGKYGKGLNPTAETLEAIAPRPCLGLLGEPGIGKTTAVYKYVEALRKQLGPDEELVHWNFAFGGSLDDLAKEAAFLQWLTRGAASPTLHLFLDSLDEYTDGGAERVAKWILHHLRRGPVDRLRLRLACRTAAWPRMLDDHLPAFWKEDANNKGTKVGVYELAPLRLRDVEQAASPNATGFLREVEQRQAVALAIKPITLDFLLSAYARDGQLPTRRWDLYERGCRMLCDEQSSTQSIRQTQMNVDQRFAIAARIAAVMMLGARSMIWRGPDSGDMPPEAVRDHDLYGGTEKAGEGTVSVGADELKELFDVSGLFTARGKRALGWMHQTYAEFMAAWFLQNRGLLPDEMLREVTHDAVPGRVIPVLREVAAWLAGGNQSFFRLLAHRDPEVLLRSDFAKVENADREMLVGTLLDRIAAKNMLDDQLWGSLAIREFKHPGLAAQLRPYIIAKDVYFMARRAAIDIAKHCQLNELIDAFLTVALDAGDDLHIRTHAARMVVAMGGRAAKQQLKPFIVSQPRSEAEDDLKGFAMQASWPDDLTAKDLFGNLTAPYSRGYIGAYFSGSSGILVGPTRTYIAG
jgi:hypothetical protein